MTPHPRLPAPPGPRVRWRYRGRWRYGFLHGPESDPDGSVRVYDDRCHAAHSLPRTTVQRETRGPRGGRRWEWIEPPARTAPVVVAPRPLWRPPEGKAELFNQLELFCGGAAA